MGSHDSIVGVIGNSTLNLSGADTVTGLGGTATVIVNPAAVVTAAVITSGWAAGVGTVNNGSFTVNSTAAAAPSGSAINLANGGGNNGYAINDSFGGYVITASSTGKDTITATSDTINSLIGTDSLTGGNDTINGVTDTSTVVLIDGTNTISNLGGTAEIQLSLGATLTASILSTGWTAGLGTNNSGSITLNTDGYNIDLTNSTSNGYLINDTSLAGGASIIGSSGNDTIHAQINDTITTGNGSDIIYAGNNNSLTLGLGINTILLPDNHLANSVQNETVSGLIANDLIGINGFTLSSVQAGNDANVTVDANGIVTFTGAGLSLANELTEINSYFAAVDVALANEVALFKDESVPNNSYLYIYHGGANNYSLVELIGIPTVTNITDTIVGSNIQITHV